MSDDNVTDINTYRRFQDLGIDPPEELLSDEDNVIDMFAWRDSHYGSVYNLVPELISRAMAERFSEVMSAFGDEFADSEPWRQDDILHFASRSAMRAKRRVINE